jgi:hypothetical protein
VQEFAAMRFDEEPTRETLGGAPRFVGLWSAPLADPSEPVTRLN